MPSSEPQQPDEQPRSTPAINLLDPKLQRIAHIIGVMLIAGGALWAFTIVWPFISMVISTTLPFVVGLIFAYIFDPFVTFAQRKLKINRVGGVFALYLVFALLITAFIAMVLPILITQIRGAYTGITGFLNTRLENMPELQKLQQDITLWLEERGINIEEYINEIIRSQGVRDAASTAASSGAKLIGDIISLIINFIFTVIGIGTFMLFAILVNIYLLVDFSKLRGVMEVMIPNKHQERTFSVLKKVDIAVGGFIRGMLIVACLVGVMTFLGLTLVGVGEYALLLGIIAGVGNLVPYLGPIFGGAPAALYILFSDKFDGTQERLIALGGLAVVVIVIQTIESLVFQPKIVGQSAQLHPLAVLFALAFGANFGILGMIVAVPTACIIRVLIKEFYWDAREQDWQSRTGKRRLSDLGPRKRKKEAKA